VLAIDGCFYGEGVFQANYVDFGKKAELLLTGQLRAKTAKNGVILKD
jgi:hypothetical protein